MRRILVPKTIVGRIDLAGPQAHHLRDVLRLAAGAIVEVFDETGTRGRGRIVSITPVGVSVEVDEIARAGADGPSLTIAAAVPKGARADWMIEKLSELGVDTLVPLSTRRSIVLPRGCSKQDRWRRLAAESAEQSARTGVMRIEPLTELPVVIERAKAAGSALWHLSLDEDAVPILQLISALGRGLIGASAGRTAGKPAGYTREVNQQPALMVLVGPEGGWSTDEADAFRAARIVPVRLTRTILRVETAAIAAAVVIQSALTLTLPAATILAEALPTASDNPRKSS
ncbi:MAG: RsmE family RNA methyltransferase [Tepidisphaeraceae bacterium]|jgi:16S rRNA (uracil1498-N3)-methyltransferase